MNWQPPKDGTTPKDWQPTNTKDGTFIGATPKQWTVLIALVVVVPLLLIGALSGDDGTSRSGLNAYNDSAHAACADFTRDRLKSPSTADFPEYDDRGVNITSSGATWTVASFVDSENGFGAEVRTSFRCVVINHQGDTWRLDSWTER